MTAKRKIRKVGRALGKVSKSALNTADRLFVDVSSIPGKLARRGPSAAVRHVAGIPGRTTRGLYNVASSAFAVPGAIVSQNPAKKRTKRKGKGKGKARKGKAKRGKKKKRTTPVFF